VASSGKRTKVGARSLREGAIGLPGVLLQSTTHLAPAVTLLLSLQFLVLFAGAAVPLALVASFAIALMLALSAAELAKRFPSAGGYYAYTTRTLGPRAGFLTAWMYALYSPILPGFMLAYLGSVLDSSLRAEYGVHVPWWTWVVGGACLVAVVAYRGIQLSVRTLVVLGLLEVAIVVALAISGLLHPGPGGVNLAPFRTSTSPSLHGLYLAIVFSIGSYSGWEAAAPLAEESRAARRAIPLAMVVSLVGMGIFMVFCSWGILVGWGTKNLFGFLFSREFPTFVLARHLWGGAWVLVLFALLNSALGVAVACNNVATRMWFSMARDGVLPRGLAVLHPRHRTPTRAIALQLFVVLLLGLGLGAWLGPFQAFLLLGLVFSLTLVFVYGAGNVGVVRYFTGEARRELNPLLHLLFPAASTAALVWAAWRSVSPLPPSPTRYAPVIVLLWLALGLVVVLRSPPPEPAPRELAEEA
jgi:amino acid transporter